VSHHIEKIISGGQSGVDRAALDFALQNNIPCGGRCPKGRLAEDGRIDDKYPLTETKTTLNVEHTKLNVKVNIESRFFFSLFINALSF